MNTKIKNYKLEQSEEKESGNVWKAAKDVYKFVKEYNLTIVVVLVIVVITSIASIISPYIIGTAVDQFILNRDADNLLGSVLLLCAVYAVVSIGNYFQIRIMGTIGQKVLFKVRNAIFGKIQSLPLAFFNANKTGDLISRINTDTEKLNQAFSEVILRVVGDGCILLGIGIFVFILNPKLAVVLLSVSVGLFIITKFFGRWIQRRNKLNLKASGDLSAELQENLNNFKLIVAFNRRDYFRENFEKVNKEKFNTATAAGIANGVLSPIYTFGSQIAQVMVLLFGIFLISQGELTIGLLFSFITYANDFYAPLREVASLFASLQSSVAAWHRISEILNLETNLSTIKSDEKENQSNDLLNFKNVDFAYEEDQKVLKDINLTVKSGETYALVGPTGGGKSTTASLMARLFDPTAGKVEFMGKDLRTYSPEEISKNIGFILQEPILFSGTITENIKYGNEGIANYSNKQLTEKLNQMNLGKIAARFKDGLKTKVKQNGEGISLGQKQLVAFLRILLRSPKLLILDEATANIDTVTEELLQEILDKMPKETAKVIIAHRLNTIKSADKIYFIAAGQIQEALEFEDVLELIEKGGRS